MGTILSNLSHFLVQEKRTKIPVKTIPCFACNPPGIKNLNNSRSHRADRFGNENTVIIELKIEK